MSDPGAEQDRADMARLVQGEDAALDDLMGRHARRLLALLIRLLRNETDAEDVAQETFTRVYEHRDRFDPAYEFRTWLYTIATNLVRDRYRWRSRHPEQPLELPGTDGPAASPTATLADGAPTPPDSAVARERAEAVRTAVGELSEDLRLPLVLAEFEEWSHARIASLLGCTTKAVEMKTYRARQHLRTRLQRWLEA